MASDLANHPDAKHTMEMMEEAKRSNADGDEYWRARDVARILEYNDFNYFVNVVERATASIRTAGGDPSHHVRETSTVVRVRGGVKERGKEFFLSRGACYLIAMNGDPAKPRVAGAQEYFAVQTRLAELAQERAADHARLRRRQKVSKALKGVADVAKDKGVERFDWFNGARYRGMYEMSFQDVRRHKGLRAGENLLDRAAPLELSAHEFQSNLAKERLLRSEKSGQEHAIEVNRETAAHVRKLIINQTGQAPENLALEKDSIQDVKKRLKAPTKALPSLKGG